MPGHPSELIQVFIGGFHSEIGVVTQNLKQESLFLFDELRSKQSLSNLRLTV
jgi:hypothetical protein